jgi:hypothetical protein
MAADSPKKQNQFKANSKPIKANRQNGEIDAKCVFTKDYEEKCGIGAMNKQSQNKANSKPISNPLKLVCEDLVTVLAEETKDNFFQTGLAFEVVDSCFKHYFGTPFDRKAEYACADCRERNAF